MDWLFELTSAQQGWLAAAALLIAAALLGALSRSIFYRHVEKLSERTETRVDDLLLAATRRWWPVWFLLAALVPAAHLTPLAADARLLVRRLAISAFAITLTLAASRFVGLWFDRSGAAAPGLGRPSLVRNIVRTGVLVAGALLVLDNLGVQIAPLLTALGIGSLAVALALQPTLSNLFAGIHLSVSRPLKVGDFVELDNGTQGWVEDIGWRATRIRQLPNNFVVVPNAKLADMILKNFEEPGAAQSVVVPMGVAYGSDLDRVERAVLEVARDCQATVEGAEREHEPVVRFHTFGASSIDFNVVLRARHTTERFLLVHEFVKRVKARFDAEGIEIPFPQRVVHLAGRREEGPAVD